MVNKKNFKIISIITTVFVITTLISLKGLITKATVADRPEFDIAFSVQDEAVVGEDILVNGTITPKAFEIPVPEQEIVFIIDSDYKSNYGDLNSLMSHTVKFLDKLKDKNIKIATIEYRKDAEIKKVNNEALLDINENNSDIKGFLTTVNNKIEKTDKTNTGEALRKALYLLKNDERNKYVNKTIIFVSDSIPTARTLYDKNSQKYGDFYKDFTEETYINATTDNSNDNSKDLEYAKDMANIVRGKGYNVFTIAYGGKESVEDTKALREIHQCMSGNDMSSNNDENEGFFIVQDPKVAERVFENIADKVLQNYSLNNITMNINFTGDFSLNIGENTINLPNIKYELESVSYGKARYTSKPINFQFVIKGNKEGYQQIFDKVTISYPWQGSIEKVDINSELFITLKSNKIPNIEAKLISDKIVNYSENEIEVKYQLTPEEFEYIGNFNNAQNKELIFVIDTEINNDKLNLIKNGINNKIIDYLFNNNIKVNFTFITYNSNINSYIVDPDAKDNNGASINYQSLVRDKLKDIQISDNKERNLGGAIKKVDEVFSQSKYSNSLKNVVIIAAGDPTDTLPNIQLDKYNIITLAISKNNNYDNPYNKLKEYHDLLGGKDNNYFVSSAKENNNDLESKPNNSNEIPLAPDGNIMGEIVKRIEEFNDNSYKFNNITLNFDLASNFNVISGLQLENESNYIVKLPEIVYTATDKINYNYYKYQSNPIQISFKIKPEDGKIGTLNFANNTTVLKNYLSYKTLDNEIKKVGILTPTVIVKEQIKDITHGLYNGINNGQVSISETNSGKAFEIAQGSTVTFGATFTFSGSTDFKLNVDKNIQGVDKDNIKIYKVLNGGLVNIDDKEISGENNEFNISINVGNNTEILVVYQGKIIDGTASGQTLTNEIVFSSASKKVTIATPKQSTDSPILPDLF